MGSSVHLVHRSSRRHEESRSSRKTLITVRNQPRELRALRVFVIARVNYSTPMRRASMSAFAALACVLAGSPLNGQSGAKNGEWPTYGGDLGQHALLAARSDQRRQLQQARGRVAVQDRQPRPAARVQARGDAADGERRALHDRRHAPRGRRARRRPPASCCGCTASAKARAARARRASCPAAASRTGPTARDERILYVTPGYRLVALNAKTGAPRSGVRQQRHRRSEAGRRSGDRSR